MMQFLDEFEEHPTVYQRIEVDLIIESGKIHDSYFRI